jgi:hypothetical protein
VEAIWPLTQLSVDHLGVPFATEIMVKPKRNLTIPQPIDEAPKNPCLSATSFPSSNGAQE